MASALSPNDIQIAFVVDSKGAVHQIDQVGNSLKKFDAQTKVSSSHSNRLGKTISDDFGKIIKTALTFVTVTAVAGFFKKATDAAIEQEDAINLLDNALEKHISKITFTSTELQNLASAYQSTTKYGDEQIIMVESLLARNKQLSDESFPRALAAILDVSTGLKRDLIPTTEALSKALEDPTKYVNLLARSIGVQFTEENRKLIKSLQESGDMLGAQSVILAEVEKRFGGAAKAAGETFSGQLKSLENVFGDFLEVVGDAIIKNDDFKDVLSDLKKIFADPEFRKLAADLTTGLIKVFSSLIGIVIDVAKVIYALREPIILIGKAFLIYFAVNKILPFFNAFSTGISTISQFYKVLKLEGLNTFSALAKSTREVTGLTGSFSDAIKKIPTAVKITIVMIGIEAFREFMNWANDELVRIYDSQLRTIMEVSSMVDGEAHKITKSILDFRNASKENELAFQSATVELKKYLVEEDNNYTKQAKLKMILEKLHPEWKKYIDDIDKIGDKNRNLNVTLDKNKQVFTDISKSLGKFTKDELSKYLDKLIEQNVLTKKQSKELIDLKDKYDEHQKELKKVRDEYDKLKSSIGILSGETLKELNKELNWTVEIFDDNRDLFSDNSHESKLLKEQIDKLIKSFGGLDNVPDKLRKLYVEFNRSNVEIKDFVFWTGGLKDGLVKLMPGIDANVTKLEGFDKEVKNTKNATKDLSDKFNELVNTGNAAADMLEKLGVSANITGGIKLLTSAIGSIGTGLAAIQRPGKTFTDILSKVGGSINVATGVVSAAIGLFSLFKKEIDWQYRAADATKNLTGVSREAVKEIGNLAEEIGSTSEALREMLPTLIETANVLDDFGLKNYSIEITDLGKAIADIISESTVEYFEKTGEEIESLGNEIDNTGNLANDTQKMINQYSNSIVAFFNKIDKLGITGSQSLYLIVKQVKELRDKGLDLVDVWNKIKEKLGAAGSDWSELVGTFTKANLSANMNLIELSALSIVAAMRDAGKSTLEIIETMGAGFRDLEAKAKEAGINISDSMKRLIDISVFVDANKELVKQIDLVRGIYKELSDTDYFKQDDLNAFAESIKNKYNEILSLTKDQQLAYDLIGPSLQDIIKYSELYNLTIDDGTKALIENAKTAGAVSEEKMSAQDKEIDLLETIVTLLGGEIPYATKEAASIAIDSAKKVNNEIKNTNDLLSNTGERFNDVGDTFSNNTDGIINDFSRLDDKINDTNKRITTLGDTIEDQESRFSGAIWEHSMTSSLKILDDKIIESALLIPTIGDNIEGVDRRFFNSAKDINKYIDGINDRIKELQDLIKDEEIEQTLKDQYQNELDTLEQIIDRRETILGLSEELSSIVFNPNNITSGFNQIFDIVIALRDGIITLGEAYDEIGASFNTMIENASSLGVEGSSGIIDFIKGIRGQNIDLPEIDSYIKEQLTGRIKGLGSYLSTFVDPGAIKKTIADLEKELLTAKGEDKQSITDQLLTEYSKLDAATKDITDRFESVQTYTMGFYNSLIKEGYTVNEVIKMMGPELSKISQLAKESGVEVGAGLKELLGLQDVIDQYPELTNRIDAATQMMKAFANSGYLTEDIFKSFQKDVIKDFNDINAKVGDNKKAFQLIAPELGQLLWMASQYNMELDDGTKTLIKNAQAAGVNIQAQIPAEEKVVKLLETIVKFFGVDIPYATEEMTDAVDGSVVDINNSLSGIEPPEILFSGDTAKIESDIIRINDGFNLLSDSAKGFENDIIGINDGFDLLGSGSKEFTNKFILDMNRNKKALDEFIKLQKDAKIINKDDIIIQPGDGEDQSPGFATGGAFTVRGSGGPDSVQVGFRASPGEFVRIYTPEERRRMYSNESSGPARPTVNQTINNNNQISIVSKNDDEWKLAGKIKKIFTKNIRDISSEELRRSYQTWN